MDLALLLTNAFTANVGEQYVEVRLYTFGVMHMDWRPDGAFDGVFPGPERASLASRTPQKDAAISSSSDSWWI